MDINPDKITEALGELAGSVTVKAARNGNVQIVMEVDTLRATDQINIWRTFVKVCEALDTAGYGYEAHDSFYNKDEDSRVPWPHVWVNKPTAAAEAAKGRDERLDRVETALERIISHLTPAPSESLPETSESEKPF